MLTTAINKKDPNLPTAPPRQQVEIGNGQRGDIEGPNPSNGKEPSSEQEQKPASQPTEKKDEPNKELCTDESFKYAFCGPVLMD